MCRTWHVVGLAVVWALTWTAYHNSLHADWSYDDNFAILNNPDVTLEYSSSPPSPPPSFPSSPSSSSSLDRTVSWLGRLVVHDFWGQDISKADSHKSYRPLTTLTFRLNHALHARHVFGFHLVNLFLHCLVSSLVYSLALLLFADGLTSLLSGVLFGLHPIHTEGVSSIVGRAEPLCAVFYLTALFFYHRSRGAGPWWAHIGYIGCYALATVSKETGYTVLAVMVLYSFLASPHIQARPSRGSRPSFFDGRTAAILTTGALAYVALRSWLTSSFILYNFRHLENPIAFASSFMTRVLSSAHLHTRYLSLLVLPINLSADYSFNAIPLVESLSDPRNILSLVAYSTLVISLTITAYGTARGKSDASKVLWLLLFGVISFLPASNIFFYVGTMLAERLLYIPSIPFCILLAWSSIKTARTFHSLSTTPVIRYLLLAIMILTSASLCGWYGWRTQVRNRDWQGESELFTSALEVCPGSAKVWQSVGVLHRRTQNWTQAVEAFSKARKIEPNYCEIDYWLGVTYLNMGKTDMALHSLHKSITCIYVRVQAVTALNKIYEVLISSSPNNATHIMSWAKVLETVDQTHESASYYVQASVMLQNQGSGNQTIPILEHAISLLYQESPEPLSPVLSKDELVCTAHLWLGGAYLGAGNHPKAIEHMRHIAGVKTSVAPTYFSPLSKADQPIPLQCPTHKKQGQQALAGLYVAQIQKDVTLDVRSRLELAVMLAAIGNTDSALYQYYEGANALIVAGDLMGAQRVLDEALENTKKDRELESFKRMEALQTNLAKIINGKKNKDEL